MLGKVLTALRIAEPKKLAHHPTHAVVHMRDEDEERHEKLLLHVGAVAPDFVLRTIHGGKVSLDDALRGGEVLILTFWRYGNVACRDGIRCLQAIYDRTHTRGLNALAINHGDGYDEIAKFKRQSRLSIPIVEDGEGEHDTAAKYGVHTYPTTYVISPDRRIAERFIGFDEISMRHAFEHMGLNIEIPRSTTE